MTDEKQYPFPDYDSFFDSESIASGTECTGLIPTPPESEEEAESYTELYHIPKPENDKGNGLEHPTGIHSKTHKLE